MNTLIRCAGNKHHLIKEFQKYSTVFVEDIDPKAKCFLLADALHNEVVDLVIETRDADIKHPLLYDKVQFAQFCKRHGFDKPAGWVPDSRMIAKPRNGSGSRGQFILDRSYLIQEYVDWPEYTIDYFADREGNVISVIPRKRLEVHDGEAHKAEIDFNPILIEQGTRMGQELNIKGPATMQLFFNGKDVKWIEVNPRYGGGSHLTWPIFSGPRYQVEELKMRDSNVSQTIKRG